MAKLEIRAGQRESSRREGIEDKENKGKEGKRERGRTDLLDELFARGGLA